MDVLVFFRISETGCMKDKNTLLRSLKIL